MRHVWALVTVVVFGGCTTEIAAKQRETNPGVIIVEPGEGETFQEGQLVRFLADVNDGVHSFDDLELFWQSSEDGTLRGAQDIEGTRVTFDVDTLSDGEHLITLKAVNAHGLSGESDVTIEVIPNTAPTVRFVRPTGDAIFGQSVLVEIEVDDEEEKNLERIALSWGADATPAVDAGVAPITPDSSGRAAFFLEDLAIGSHQVSVTARDTAGKKTSDVVEFDVVYGDWDGDGVTEELDCDDLDATAAPGMAEMCDGVDNDCDGDIDEDASDASSFFPDDDADTFGDVNQPVYACTQPAGHVANNLDCDDDSFAIRPTADELCDGIDNDCDGSVDEASAVDAPTWYRDSDMDLFGDPGASTRACNQPPNHVADGNDCEDANDAINPDATEVCNTLDDDCDGDVDEAGATGEATWYEDLDGDGFGTDADTLVSCSAPSGYAGTDDDCDDAVDTTYPGATEFCNLVDDDCNTLVDDQPVDAVLIYDDVDNDNYGDPATVVFDCLGTAPGVLNGDDCDDGDEFVNPGEDETCNSVDDDCDGVIDEGDAIDAIAWYPDADGDDYGEANLAAEVMACNQPTGHIDNFLDCDDVDDAINPDADEVCGNGVDEDCNGVLDDTCTLDHCGVIDVSETWQAGLVHRVTCLVEVEGFLSPVLTIEDGAEVEVVSEGIHVGFGGLGGLDVQGTTAGVTIRSDDLVPEPGDYQGLRFGPNDLGSTIVGLTISDGGSTFNTRGAALWVDEASITVDDSVITRARGNGVRVINGGEAVITNSRIEENVQTGVYVDVDSGLGGTGAFDGNVVTGNLGTPLLVPMSATAALGANNQFSGNVLDYIQLAFSTLRTDATWYLYDVPWAILGAGHARVGDVSTSPTLTIESGNTVLLDGGLRIGDGEPGALVADGVLFTSAEASPSAGDFPVVLLADLSGGSSLDGATIEYGGGSGNAALDVRADIAIDGITIRDSGANGIVAFGAELELTNSVVVDSAGIGVDATVPITAFTNNDVSGNDHPVRLLPNDIGLLGSDSDFSGGGPILIRSGQVTDSATWQVLDVDYEAESTIEVTGPGNPELVLDDGVAIAFRAGALTVTSTGQLTAVGTSAGITLTSAASIPAPGDWGGVQVSSTAMSLLDNVEIAWAGSGGRALHVNGHGVVQNSFVHGSLLDGILVDGILATSTVLVDNTVTGNAGSGLRAVGPLTEIGGNTITGNGAHPMELRFDVLPKVLAQADLSGNGDPRVAVLGAFSSEDILLRNEGVPYVFEQGASTLRGVAQPELVIEDGVELQFDTDLFLQIGNFSQTGRLTAIGSGIRFTSAHASPAPGDWYGLSLQNGDVVIDGGTVEFGGGDGFGNIYVGPQFDTADLTAVTLQESDAYGLYIDGAGPVVNTSAMTYANNALGDVFP